MQRLRTFQGSHQEEYGEVKQILALLKSCTPAEVCAEAMEGGHLFVGKANLQECCEELACSLINLKQYMKKSTLEAAVGCWDHESKGNMSKHATPCATDLNGGLCSQGSAYATTL